MTQTEATQAKPEAVSANLEQAELGFVSSIDLSPQPECSTVLGCSGCGWA